MTLEIKMKLMKGDEGFLDELEMAMRENRAVNVMGRLYLVVAGNRYIMNPHNNTDKMIAEFWLSPYEEVQDA